MLMMMVSVCSVWGQSESDTLKWLGHYLEQFIIDGCYKHVNEDIEYDRGYYRIKYPMGDVPANVGCCTDAVIRVLREVGIDLQKLVHEDMMRGKRWMTNLPDSVVENPYKGIKPDTNIDHRRVWTLLKYFKAHMQECCCSHLWHSSFPRKDGKYEPGTIVIWDLGYGQGHIGIVVDGENVFHQIGSGQVIEPKLHEYDIVAAIRIEKAYWSYPYGINYIKTHGISK